MVDRNKVIKGLERIRDYDPMFRVAHDDEFSQYAADALALLKAQEPVEPQEKREGDYRNLYCGACGRGIVGYVKHTTGQYAKLSNYCNKCGQEVKWK